LLFDQSYAFEATGDTLVTAWLGDPLPARLTHMVTQLEKIYAKHPRGVFLYSVVTSTAGMPSPEAREVMRRQFHAMRDRLRAAGIVLEKTGVEGTLARTILSTVTTLTRQPFALRTFGDRVSAATWVVKQGATAPASAILACAESLLRGLHGAGRGASGKATPNTPR